MNAVLKTPAEYAIADLSLASWGRKEIRIAETEMPGLMAIRSEFAKAQSLVGTGLRTAFMVAPEREGGSAHCSGGLTARKSG